MHHHMMAHDPTLVVLSFVVAYFASYTALDMGTRLRKAVGKVRNLWLTGSAVVLGGGIFSMHFIAMLALHTDVQIGYDFTLTALSLLLAIGFVGVGFHLVTRQDVSIVRQILAGIVVGLGVSAMHYTGMAAVVLPGVITYNPLIVALSVGIAVVAATAALWLTLNLRSFWQRAVAAGVMAVAVCGMHYTAMSAASIALSAEATATVDPLSRTLVAVAVAVGVFMILCLAMVSVFVDRRFELLAEREAESLRAANARLRNEVEERQAIARELQASNAALIDTQAAVRNLLDNADQGFLTVGADLRVGEQFSAACINLLETPPSGHSIVDLLFQDGPQDARRDMVTILESVFRDTDEFTRDLKVELLRASFSVRGKSLRVEYKYLGETDDLMVIITDMTETMRLTQEIERERRRLEMVVLAIAEAEAFGSLVDDYRAFLHEELPALAERFDTAVPSGQLRRRLHTYKGLLSQFSFHASPQALHEMESALAGVSEWTADRARMVLCPERLRDALECDLNSLVEVFGEDRLPSSRQIAVSPKLMTKAIESARKLLQADEGRTASPKLRELLYLLVRAGEADAKSMIALHARGVPALAERLEKQAGPVRIEGDDLSLSPERYAPFFRSLVHVFRNAVDHGFETPDERIAAGKPADASLTCTVRDRGEEVEIELADDGRGVDRAALERRLVAAGKHLGRVKAMSLEDLVFTDGLTSREDAGEISGRGVGLAAVKHELDRLGGTAEVESEAGFGARFRFRIPRGADEAMWTAQTDAKVA